MMWDCMAAPAPAPGRGLRSAHHLAEAPGPFELRSPAGGSKLRLLIIAAL